MKKILAIGASNSKGSINREFARYAASQVKSAESSVYDMSKDAIPLFSVDLEEEEGVPAPAHEFVTLIGQSDGIILSLAEHNGMLSAAFKNLWDWSSRIEQKIWQEKPILLLSTSPGARGGKTVLTTIEALLPHHGGKLIASFSLGSFYDQFADSEIIDADMRSEFQKKIRLFEERL